MDSKRFDALAKSLTNARSRRGALGALLGGALGVPGLIDASAHNPLKKCKKKSGKQKKACIKKAKAHNATHTGTPSAPPTTCTPTTCTAQGKNCGTIADGCNNQLRCGPDSCGDGFSCTGNVCRCGDGTAVCEGICCQAGEVCQNGNGACCTPVDPCGPNSCGQIADNCGTPINCGTCTPPQTCGGATPSVPNVCGCTPNCTGKCGGASDGCSGTCTGSCPTCQTCSGVTCTNVPDGPSCNFTNFGSAAIGQCQNGTCTCKPRGGSCNCDIIATVRGCCDSGCDCYSGTCF